MMYEVTVYYNDMARVDPMTLTPMTLANFLYRLTTKETVIRFNVWSKDEIVNIYVEEQI